MVDDIEGLWEDPDYLGPPLEAWRWHKTLGAGGQGVALLYRRIDPATNVTQAVSLVPFSRVFPKIRKKRKVERAILASLVLRSNQLRITLFANISLHTLSSPFLYPSCDWLI